MAIGFAYGPADLTVGNPSVGSFLYLKGDEFTDGSIRAVVDDVAENWQLELRTNGVWNTTGLQIAASSVHLGRELLLSGAGEFASTIGFNTGIQSLIPHVDFTDAGTGTPHTPVLAAKIFRQIVQSVDTTEQTLTQHIGEFLSPLRGIRTKIYLQTGATAATEPVTFNIRRATVDGFLLFQEKFPASQFSANTEVELPLEGFQLEDGDTVFGIVESGTAFTLKGDGAEFWLAIDVFPLTTVDMLEESLVLSNDGEITFANDGRLAASNITL